MHSTITYSAPNVPRKGAAAFASVRSYYFRMFVANFRRQQNESCADIREPRMAQMRAWFHRAHDIAAARQAGIIR